jgi:hypothetical protein
MEQVLKTPQTQEECQTTLQHFFASTTLSPTSKTQYALKIAQWLIYLTPTSKQNRSLYTLLYNPQQSYQCLITTPAIKHSPQNHHIYISAVVAFIKHILQDQALFNQWKEIERTNSTSIVEHYENNAPTEKQKDKLISFQELQTARLSLPKGSIERLLLSFYTLIEPIRADYFATEIVSPSQNPIEENYIILAPSVSSPTAAQLMVQDFKTKQKYRAIENQIPQELLSELIESLKLFPRKYLFTTPENPQQPFTRKLFSNWACRTLTRILKQPMTLTALRHIYISNKIQSKTPTSELKEIAKKMGHSRDMQRIYEWQQ